MWLSEECLPLPHSQVTCSDRQRPSVRPFLLLLGRSSLFQSDDELKWSFLHFKKEKNRIDYFKTLCFSKKCRCVSPASLTPLWSLHRILLFTWNVDLGMTRDYEDMKPTVEARSLDTPIFHSHDCWLCSFSSKASRPRTNTHELERKHQCHWTPMCVLVQFFNSHRLMKRIISFIYLSGFSWMHNYKSYLAHRFGVFICNAESCRDKKKKEARDGVSKLSAWTLFICKSLFGRLQGDRLTSKGSAQLGKHTIK